MKLKVVTPEDVVLEENVDSVFARASDGDIGILKNHIPMVTPLSLGTLRYVKDGEKHRVAVMGGLLHTDGEDIVVLSDIAECADTIDEIRAKDAKERAEARLKQQRADVDIERAKLALSRAVTRLKTVSNN